MPKPFQVISAVLALAIALLSAVPAGAQIRRTAAGQPVVNDPTTASQGEFAVAQISTTDPQALRDAWAQTTPGIEISTQHSATRNQPIHTYIIFGGCKADAEGKCNLVARFEVFDPSGKSYGVQDNAVLLDGLAPPKGSMGLGKVSLGFRIEDGEPLGPYKVVVRTTDKVAGVTLTTQDTLTIVEAPLVGGWQAVANPNADAQLRALAIKALPKIPRKKPRLARIERAESQVVAGINYRLVVKLKDGTRWTMKVWKKLDGTIEVSEVGQVR